MKLQPEPATICQACQSVYSAALTGVLLHSLPSQCRFSRAGRDREAMRMRVCACVRMCVCACVCVCVWGGGWGCEREREATCMRV